MVFVGSPLPSHDLGQSEDLGAETDLTKPLDWSFNIFEPRCLCV